MPEFNQKYNIQSLSVCFLLFVYHLCISNHWEHYSNQFASIIHKIYLLDYTSCLIVINIIGLYLFLKNLSFTVNIQCSLQYSQTDL
jgi:hypothetical protein